MFIYLFVSNIMGNVRGIRTGYGTAIVTKVEASRLASWRQYFFARPTRHDSARSWLLRLLELRLTNFPTYFTYLLT